MTADISRPSGAGRLAVCVALVALASDGAGAVVFTTHYRDAAGRGFFDPNLGPARREAFEYALSIWESRVTERSTTNVDVYASFEPLGGGASSAILGSGGPASFTAGFAGAQSNTAYPSALANYLAGKDLNGSKAEVEISFNSDVDDPVVLGRTDWYYGLDGNAGPHGIDLVSVSLHELAHSLGFISAFNSDGTNGIDLGSRGVLTNVFDRYLVNGAGNRLIDLAPRPSNVTRPVYWDGPFGVQQYQLHGGDGRPPMYAPSQFSADSSLSHLDEDRFSGQFELMTPFASSDTHLIDDVTRGILADIGWQSAGVGDADASGQVGSIDLLAIMNRLGKSYGQAGYWAAADLNSDGSIGAADLELAKEQFGRKGLVGARPGRSLVAGRMVGFDEPVFLPADGYRYAIYATVPEPVTALILVVGIAVAWRRRAAAGVPAPAEK